MRKVFQGLIRVYQRTLSLDHGPLARFWPHRICGYSPTCSEFGYQAIGKYGVLRGTWLTAKRILRCVPWKPGGFDPVP